MPNAKERYEKLTGGARQQFLQRARHNALLTIPSLVPLEGHEQSSHLIEPYQGLGARLVMHLSNRIVVGMLPGGRPYMRFDLPPEERMKTEGEVDPDIEKGLALSEQLVQVESERAQWRDATLQELQQLIVAGNVLEFIQPDNTLRLFRLDQYVVRRDHGGQPLEIIIKEMFSRDALPEGVSARLASAPSQPDLDSPDAEIELYTHIRLVQERGVIFYRVSQSVADTPIPGTEQTFRVDELPYIAHRWTSTPGEDYGRSKIEENIGDLRSLEALEKNMLELAAMAGRHFIMIKPGATGGGLKSRITRAANGSVVIGDPDSVDMKTFEAVAGYQITAQQVASIRESLARAYLLGSEGQRNAERVTAVEIERDIQELEGALGGVFSSLSGSMTEARTEIMIINMQRDGKLPPWPKGSVTPVVLTGLEALSRERDVGRAVQAGNIVNAFGPDAVDVVKLDTIINRAFIGLGFPDAVRTEQETDQVRQQRAQREALQAGVGQALPAIAREAAKGDQ